MSELTVLQAVRLKGRVSRDDLAATLGEEISLTSLTGLSARVCSSTVRSCGSAPTAGGALRGLLADERSNVDAAAVLAAYGEFSSVNAEFKALVTDWQLKDGRPNTHEDSRYDAAVLARLDDVHRRVTPIIAAAAAQLPRLHRYSVKLQAALDNIHAGETMWLTQPLIDSYHTVWFELHEELILAAARTRENDDA